MFDADEADHVQFIVSPHPAVPCPVVSTVAAVPPIGTAGRIVPDGTPHTENPNPIPVPNVAPGGAVRIAKSN